MISSVVPAGRTRVDWKKLYTDAVLESDSTRIMAAIAEAERAMDIRLKQLILPNMNAELDEIENAAKALAVLKAERQAWKAAG